MSKPKVKSEPVARTAKPKSAKQLAKRAANIAAWEARNAALRNGTFKGVVEKAAEAKARHVAERMAETEKARTMVVTHMSHPVYGQRLSRFLNGSKADPRLLANVVIPNWIKTQGIVVDHVRPTT